MIGRLLTAALTVIYPALVFTMLHFWNIRGLGFVLLCFGILRLLCSLVTRWRGRGVPDSAWWLAALLIGLGGVTLWSQEELSARLYPVIVNAGMLVWFGSSLIHPPSVVEKIARIAEPNLPRSTVHYTRNVTALWCVFFLANGMAALYTALFSSLVVWTLYNGAIAYALMGVLFGIEYLVRSRVRMRYEAGSA